MFMVCIEWWTFEVGTFLAGLMSVTELGAQAVIYVLASVAYMVPLGLGVAASVRVGSALGAGDAQQARHSCATALLCAGVCALVTGIFLAALKDVVAYAFTSDKDVVSLVSQVMPIFAPFHLFDALAGTSGGVLRGAGKQKMGALLNAIGYYVFGFPLGASLMFAANHGIIGLWSGLTACVFFQTLFYLVYIWRINWNRAAEQAQVRAGLRGTKEAVPTATGNLWGPFSRVLIPGSHARNSVHELLLPRAVQLVSASNWEANSVFPSGTCLITPHVTNHLQRRLMSPSGMPFTQTST
ncbi:multidrug and toxin extrusion protein 2 [Delphinus delphis]|uniref:multidrug and toxin extrusion protein 2 n=1 Tax=Delphinus delphis TaxID=9728 RepID=UPI003750B30B